MVKWKISKSFDIKEISKNLNLEETGLLMIMKTFEEKGLEVTIDNLKEKVFESKEKIQDIINKLIEKNYVEEIKIIPNSLNYGNLDFKTGEFSLNTQIIIILGMNEATIISGIISQIKQNELSKENYFEGKYWAKKSFENWRKEIFPFFSIQTIKRTFAKLEDMGILLKRYSDKNKFDRILYSTIDFDKLNEVVFNK